MGPGCGKRGGEDVIGLPVEVVGGYGKNNFHTAIGINQTVFPGFSSEVGMGEKRADVHVFAKLNGRRHGVIGLARGKGEKRIHEGAGSNHGKRRLLCEHDADAGLIGNLCFS